MLNLYWVDHVKILSFLSALIALCVIRPNTAAPILTNDIQAVNCDVRGLNSTECLRAQIYFYLRRLKSGLKEAEVSSVDPLHIDISHFSTDKDKLLLNLTVSNVSIQGLSTLDISTINLNQEDGKVEIFGKIALLTVETEVFSEGGVLDFPLHGHGHLKLNLYDVSTAFMMYYSDKDNMVNVMKLMSDFTPSKIVAKFKGTVDDDDKLGNSVNTFLNENSYEIYNDSKFLILSNIDKLFLQMINNALFYHYVRKDQSDLHEGR